MLSQETGIPYIKRDGIRAGGTSVLMRFVKFFLIKKLEIKAIFFMYVCKAVAQLQESVWSLLTFDT